MMQAVSRDDLMQFLPDDKKALVFQRWEKAPISGGVFLCPCPTDRGYHVGHGLGLVSAYKEVKADMIESLWQGPIAIHRQCFWIGACEKCRRVLYAPAGHHTEENTYLEELGGDDA